MWKVYAMKNMLYRSFFLMFLLGCLTSCSTSNPVEKTQNPVEESGVTDIEAVKGRLNVYESMARTAKYNVVAANRNLYQKAVIDTRGKNAAQIFASISNVKNDGEQPFYEASRNLDFAIVYATVNLTANDRFVKNYIYNKTAQQLALVAIKNHQDTLFALRKIKELDRRIASQQKSVKYLDNKLEKNGSLSPVDLEYKKSLEVSINKMQQFKDFLDAFVKDFASLVKVEYNDLHLQGKNFYELQDFDQRNKLTTFQNTALDYRTEFDLARKEIFGFNPRYAQKNLENSYSETKRLDINGVDANTDLFQKSLSQKAENVAQSLINDVNAYLSEQDLELKKIALRNAFDKLGMAIMVQIELDYAMVKAFDVEFAEVSTKTAQLRSEIRTTERKRNLSDAEKSDLINQRLLLDESEWKQTQISSDRAAALRALYFHAGLSPLSEELLKEKIAQIVVALKKAFNQDMIDMLAKADNRISSAKNTGNTWAKQDNWLEILIDQGGKKEPQAITLPLKPAGNFDAYEDPVYDKMPVMQLGAYRQKENADIEWQMLKEIYPEFSNVKPKIESSMQNGKMMYRLIVKSKNGGWQNICNKLRADKVECILRQK